ncbi:MAG: DUF2070 family protein [Candidatus Micrarchaeaceae archaeon]
MPRTDNVTRYSKYFKINAPNSAAQAAVMLAIGLVAGALAIIATHYSGSLDSRLLVIGTSIGVMAISLPALLTVLFIKAANWRMQIKHALFSTNIIATFYGVFFIAAAVAFRLASTGGVVIAYAVLLLANAGIYGYWFIMGNVVIGLRKGNAVLYSAVQPVLDVLLFVPFSTYLFGVNFPLNITLVKLVAGMAIFLAASYAFLYAVDRPPRKLLGESGVKIMSAMLSYWLYNISGDARLIGSNAAARRNAEIDIIRIKQASNKDKGNYSAVLVNPDMHFGPFANAGGSVATVHIGTKIAKEYGAAPFVLHSTVDLRDNPVSASQVFRMSKEITAELNKSTGMHRATGSVSFGEYSVCKAIDIRLDDTRIFILTKAPHVTEDIARQVGMELKRFAKEKTKSRNVIIVDAHNSRFESAQKDELRGVYEGSIYAECYKKAIATAIEKEQNHRIRMGFAHKRLSELMGKRKDIGEGQTSVWVIEQGNEKKRFCIVYFDANNALPGFRQEVIAHIREKFNMEAEICTTDTHSINMLSEGAGTALGRYTTAKEAIPALDLLIGYAIGSIDDVYFAYSRIQLENFMVWGPNAYKLIEETSKEIRRTVKRVTPFIVLAAFVIAAWIISLV